MPSTIAIDQKTDTVYVTNNTDNTVSVFNGATCNARDTSGCGQTPATVPVGLGPLGIFADPVNHTVYVANFDTHAGDSTTVSMIDSATCNATDLTPVQPRAPDGQRRQPAGRRRRQPGHPHRLRGHADRRLAVFDANTCNATVHSGAARSARSPVIPTARIPPRSTRRTTPCTRPTTTTRSRRSTCVTATPATWPAAPRRRPAP